VARRDVFVVAHGGPIASPDDAALLFDRIELDGFVGASSMERLPIEEPLRANTAAFAALRTRR
jgi:predicted TIM-barrel enzyme